MSEANRKKMYDQLVANGRQKDIPEVLAKEFGKGVDEKKVHGLVEPVIADDLVPAAGSKKKKDK